MRGSPGDEVSLDSLPRGSADSRGSVERSERGTGNCSPKTHPATWAARRPLGREGVRGWLISSRTFCLLLGLSVSFPVSLSFPCLSLPLCLPPRLCPPLVPWVPLFLRLGCLCLCLTPAPASLCLCPSVSLSPWVSLAAPASSRNSVCQSVCLCPFLPPPHPPSPPAGREVCEKPRAGLGTRFSQGPPPRRSVKCRKRGARSWGSGSGSGGGRLCLRGPR